MIPIRVEETGVEPVSVVEMRGYLRLSSDETAEDALIGRLIPAARAAVEAAARRLLRPARFRVVLAAWPGLGLLPLPLSPLVAVLRAGRVDAGGTVTEIEPGLVEVGAGCGGEGPPVPEPLVQTLRLTIADLFENRGDAGAAGPAWPLPHEAAGLAAACRRMRL